VRSLSRVSMGAIFLGVFSLILVASIMNGLGGSIEDRMLRVEPRLTVLLQKNDDWIASQMELEKILGPYLERGVSLYAAQTQDVVLKTVDAGFGGGVLKGIPQIEIDRLVGVGKVVWADPLRSKTETLRPGEVLIGSDLALQLSIFEGDEVTVIAPEGLLLPPGEVPPMTRLKVIGVITTGHTEFDNKTLIYSGEAAVPHLRSAAGVQKQFEIRFDDAVLLRPMEEILKQSGWQVQSWIDRNSTLVFALRLERNLVGLLLGLAAMIASFSVITVITLLMNQKQKEMAILSVLGLSLLRVRRLFLGLGCYMSWIAVFSGALLGVFAAVLLDNFSGDWLPAIYHDQSLPAKVNPVQVLTILCVGVVYSTLVIWWVVRRQSISSPAPYLSARKPFNP
jgi:lipoprotein-releasing system permease protein